MTTMDKVQEVASRTRSGRSLPWIMRMDWNDLAFLHWPIAANQLRGHLPASLELDTYEGQAWLGMTPFWMSNVRPRLFPPIPGVSRFPELNVRTYVSYHGRPGIWFFSLDAASTLAVAGASVFYRLPYFRATMSVVRQGDKYHYVSDRFRAPDVGFKARYWPTGSVFHAEPGTLEHFLTERYCLYTTGPNDQILRGDISHERWPLQVAEAEIEANTMASPLGIHLTNPAPLVHFAQVVHVRAWYLAAA